MAQKTQKRTDQTATLAQEQSLRAKIAHALGLAPADLHEWNTRVCPECYKDVELYRVCRATGQDHLPPLYYALACSAYDDDMPLGMGSSAVAALADLLWNIRAARILADLRDA
jgi:hypothetical protein